VIVAKIEQHMPEWATIPWPAGQKGWFHRPQVLHG